MMDLKTYILHQFREMKREMLVAIEGVSEEDLTSHKPVGHWPIAWVVQHCCRNMDTFVHRNITGEFFLEHEERYMSWPPPEPHPGDVYPSLDVLIARWTTVLDASIAAFEAVPDARLQEPGNIPIQEPLVESCLRVINHQNVHLRNIWCILGERRVDEKWAEQQTWLA